ncbi:MAG: FAD/NAD(P)-binding protein [Candidatus Sulfotelmatobacter sp.]
MKEFRLAIVGGGPSCTYVLERLAATAPHIREPFALQIHVFEKTGEFGSGQVHSPNQPSSSFLNRIAGQVAFAADETVEGAGPLLPREQRPTLHEWCRTMFENTGDPVFDLEPESWPKRKVHGLALQHAFRNYLISLGKHSSVRVHLHQAEVIDVQEFNEDCFRVSARGIGATPLTEVQVEQVLLVTGHSCSDPRLSEVLSPRVEFARQGKAVYISCAYPLEQIPTAAASSGKVVGTDGMGLTAIDVILYLTEGRGGTFERQACSGRVVYRPSGEEPSCIVPFSATGLFTFARPFNAKEKDPSTLEHRPVFLTELAIDRLRESVGRPLEISPFGVQRQLDFERDVFPLVLLEMSFVYYKTLLGEDFGSCLARAARTEYEAFLQGKARTATPEQAVALLLEPVEAVVSQAFDEIECALEGRPTRRDCEGMEHKWSLTAALNRYRFVVFGPNPASRLSPNGHNISPEGNRFSWDRIINPIPPEECSSPERFRAALMAFMDRDHLWAAQNNLDNPPKAAADGVWRDLRQVLAYAIDFGGLTAQSHRRFLSVYMRHHNRLANGAALEVMEKIQALITHGLLDVSVGPNPAVELDQVSQLFVLRGRLTGAKRQLDTIIDAKVHAFDPERDVSPLYRNMLGRGLIRIWRNPGVEGSHFEPGGLALDAEFHPIRTNGRVDPRLTFLGPPSEGVMFFQLGALRPNQNHHVMRDIVGWVRGFWVAVRAHCSPQADSPAPGVGGSPTRFDRTA